MQTGHNYRFGTESRDIQSRTNIYPPPPSTTQMPHFSRKVHCYGIEAALHLITSDISFVNSMDNRCRLKLCNCHVKIERSLKMKINLKLNDLINKINFMDDVMTGQNGGCFMKARTERGSLADFQKERVKQPTTKRTIQALATTFL